MPVQKKSGNLLNAPYMIKYGVNPEHYRPIENIVSLTVYHCIAAVMIIFNIKTHQLTQIPAAVEHESSLVLSLTTIHIKNSLINKKVGDRII